MTKENVDDRDLFVKLVHTLNYGQVSINSSETCICARGHFVEYFYDSNGNLTDTIDMLPGGTILNISIGQWHSLKSLESGTVLLEAKDGKWEKMREEDILIV